MRMPQAAARGTPAVVPSLAEVAGLAAAMLAPPPPVPLVVARPRPSRADMRAPPLAALIALAAARRPPSRLAALHAPAALAQAAGAPPHPGSRQGFRHWQRQAERAAQPRNSAHRRRALTAPAAPRARPEAAPAARQCQTAFGRSRHARRRNSSLRRQRDQYHRDGQRSFASQEKARQRPGHSRRDQQPRPDRRADNSLQELAADQPNAEPKEGENHGARDEFQ